MGLSGGPTTRSGLVAAQLIGGGKTVSFMFNPDKLTIGKTNTFNPGTNTGKTTEDKKFKNGTNQTLKFMMWFDTYMDGTDAVDVRTYTDVVFGMMGLDPNSGSAPSPPVVEFKWNTFSFHGMILSITQVFELFKYNGMPVRASLDVSMEEWPPSQVVGPTFANPDDLSETQLASKMTGMGMIPLPKIDKTVTMTASMTLSAVAATETANPAVWRNIASTNNIEDPLHVPNGTPINIPASNPPPTPPAPPQNSSNTAQSSNTPVTAPKRPN